MRPSAGQTEEHSRAVPEDAQEPSGWAPSPSRPRSYTLVRPHRPQCPKQALQRAFSLERPRRRRR
eukprot:7471483-Pyramimonas_sp.AAC.1